MARPSKKAIEAAKNGKSKIPGRLVEKQCRTCGESFWTYTRNRIFCGVTCQYKPLEIKIVGQYAYVSLLNSDKKAVISREDAPLVEGKRWRLSGGSGYVTYNVQKKDRLPGQNFKAVYLHRLVNNTPDGLLTDHINGDKLDCRRENLRSATPQQNAINKSSQANNKTGEVGVQYRPQKWFYKNPYIARIAYGRKQIYLGCYPTKEQAAEAYRQAAIRLHGEFRRVHK